MALSSRTLDLSRYICEHGTISIGYGSPQLNLRQAQALVKHTSQIRRLVVKVPAVTPVMLQHLVSFLRSTSMLTMFSPKIESQENDGAELAQENAYRATVDSLLGALLRNRRGVALEHCCFCDIGPSQDVLLRLYERFWSSLRVLHLPRSTFRPILEFGVGKREYKILCQPQELALLLASLPRGAKLMSLKLRGTVGGSSLSDVDLLSILRAIQGITALRSLVFDHINLEDSVLPQPGTQHAALDVNTTLKEIDFQYCSFRSSQSLTILGQFQGLEQIYFGSCSRPTWNEDRPEFGPLLRNNGESLRQFSWWFSGIYDDVLRHLAFLLRSEECALEDLQIPLCSADMDGFQDFCLAMKENNTVKHVSFSFYELDVADRDASFMLLFQVLEELRGLGTLSLYGGALRNIDLRTLEIAVRQNDRLRHLQWNTSFNNDDDHDERIRLIDSIYFYVTSNSKGRRLLDDENVPLNVWPLILENAAKTVPAGRPWPAYVSGFRLNLDLMNLSSLFFFLKSKPELFERARRRGIVRERET